MALQTNIEWTDCTWNPWQGCHKVSPGCAKCYMFRERRGRGQDPNIVIRSNPATFNAPISKYGNASTKGAPGTYKWTDGLDVFTTSWSDFFIEEADQWRDEAWDIIRQRPKLRFFILTKRPELIASRLPSDWPLPNVIMGTSIENCDYLDRLETLMSVPAAGYMVSAEPLLGPLAEGLIKRSNLLSRLDWFIVGGESGLDARIINPKWVYDLEELFRNQHTVFNFKQWGEWAEEQYAKTPLKTQKYRSRVIDKFTMYNWGRDQIQNHINGRYYLDRPLRGI